MRKGLVRLGGGCWVRALVVGMVIGQTAVVAQRRVETQHAFDVSFAPAAKWQVTLHARGRTNPGGLGWYQFRAGPIAEYSFHSRFSLIGGYYFSQQESNERDLRGTQRPFGGLEFQVLKKGWGEVEARSLVERFVAEENSFTRLRNRVRVSAAGRVAPYGSVEGFADRKGFRSVRYSAGVRWTVGGQRPVDLDCGYFYEPRRGDLGPDRHMFLTSVHLRLGRVKRPDPDI